MTKLVLFDIDGTLLNSEGRVPASAAAAVERLRENHILTGLCTGRCASETRQFLRDFPALNMDVQIHTNGAIVKYKGEYLYDKPLPREALAEVIGDFRRRGLPYWVSGREYWYYGFRDLSPIRDWMVSDDESRDDYYDPDYYLHNDVYIAEVLLDASRAGDIPLPEGLELVPGMLVGGRPGPMLDLWAKDIDKATGVQKCLDRLGILPEEVMAFGDSFNDIPIIKLAGIGVAMGNGSQEVRRVADYVTKEIDDDGIYSALAHFGLI